MENDWRKKYVHQKPLRTAVALALKARGYEVTPVKGTGGARLDLQKTGKHTLALVRTSADRWVGWMRENGQFKGMDKAGVVIVAALDSETRPTMIDIYAFLPNEVQKAFTENSAARQKATPRLSPKAPLWVCLDETDRRNAWSVGSNLKAKALWHVEMPYGSASSDAPVQPEPSPRPSGETKESFAARVRQEFADLIGVPVDKVTVDFRVSL